MEKRDTNATHMLFSEKLKAELMSGMYDDIYKQAYVKIAREHVKKYRIPHIDIATTFVPQCSPSSISHYLCGNVPSRSYEWLKNFKHFFDKIIEEAAKYAPLVMLNKDMTEKPDDEEKWSMQINSFLYLYYKYALRIDSNKCQTKSEHYYVTAETMAVILFHPNDGSTKAMYKVKECKLFINTILDFVKLYRKSLGETYYILADIYDFIVHETLPKTFEKSAIVFKSILSNIVDSEEFCLDRIFDIQITDDVEDVIEHALLSPNFIQNKENLMFAFTETKNALCLPEKELDCDDNNFEEEFLDVHDPNMNLEDFDDDFDYNFGDDEEFDNEETEPSAMEKLDSLYNEMVEIIDNMKEKYEEELSQLRPLTVYAKAMENNWNDLKVGHFSKILFKNGLDIGQKRLFEWFHKNGYICSKPCNKNAPTQFCMNYGYMTIKNTSFKMGNTDMIGEGQTTVITPKGQRYFINKLLSEDTIGTHGIPLRKNFIHGKSN